MDKAYFKIFSTIFGNGSFYYVHHLEAAEQHPDNNPDSPHGVRTRPTTSGPNCP